VRRKSWVLTLERDARKKESTVRRRSAFRCFFHSRFFPLLLCLFSVFLLLFYLVRPAVKLTREDGRYLYLSRKTYQTACQTISRDGEDALDSPPSLNWKIQSVLTFSFRLNDADTVETLLHFCGDPYDYREVYTIGRNILCAVLPEDCKRAEAIISKAMEDTISLFSGASEVTIEGNLTHCRKLVSQTDFTDLDKLYDALMSFDGQKYYTLKTGETGLTAAEVLNISCAQLSVLNPSKSLEEYTEGDRIMLCMGKNAFPVYASFEASYTSILPYPTEVKHTRTMLIGESRVETEGVTGLALVTAKIGIFNGKAIGIEEISSEVISEAQTAVVYEGRRVDDGKPFYAPVDSERISSYFGKRTLRGEYNYHTGVDYPVPVGTYVYAAADGVVTKCGVFGNGAYGKCVVIDHENGFVTYYAHNSKLLVSVGDRVVMGEAIAKSGNTGNSTAPHCHFEIRKNGTAVNPFDYMTKP